MSDFPSGEDVLEYTCAEVLPGCGWEGKEGFKDAKASALSEAVLSLFPLSKTHCTDPYGICPLTFFIGSLPEIFILNEDLITYFPKRISFLLPFV